MAMVAVFYGCGKQKSRQKAAAGSFENITTNRTHLVSSFFRYVSLFCWMVWANTLTNWTVPSFFYRFHAFFSVIFLIYSNSWFNSSLWSTLFISFIVWKKRLLFISICMLTIYLYYVHIIHIFTCIQYHILTIYPDVKWSQTKSSYWQIGQRVN